MGADSAGVSEDNIQIRLDAKVFIKGEFIIGFAGSYRGGQIMRYHFEPPYHMPNKEIFAYMVEDFIEELRGIFRFFNYSYDEQGDSHTALFIVGYQGELFYIGSDFQVGQMHTPFMAIGSGENTAKGALYALSLLSEQYSPDDMIIMALEAAELTCASVRAPFYIYKLEKEESNGSVEGQL